MAANDSHENQQERKGPIDTRKGGTGQQTGGERGQQLKKVEREGYRGTDQKKQKDNHGGNR